MTKIKLAIGICNTGTIKAQTAFSLCRMLKDFPYDYDVLFHEGSMLHVMRERLVQKAIDLKCTHILFIDSDMYFDKDAVLKLIKRKKDIVGTNYHKRKLPAEATVQRPKKLSGLTTCDSVATGFLLINLDVFKNLPQPWFFWDREVDHHGVVNISEDFWFCRLARENGYKVWCDLEVNVGHIGDYIY